MNFRYPIFLDLTGKKCLVTGEGFEVAGKVQALVDASAQVLYVNPTAEPSIEELAALDLIRWEKRAFAVGDLESCFLAVADCENNHDIFRLAEERNVICNCVDDPEHCRFSFGSIHRQGELTIAISSNGCAPAVAVRLRQWLEQEIGPEYATFLDMLKEIRPEVTKRITDFEARRDLWYSIVDSEILDMVRAGKENEARGKLRALVDAALSSTSRSDISVEAAHR